MKAAKLSSIIVAGFMITFLLSNISYAFHSGGVGECMGCHNIHDAKSTSALLAGSDISSTCINCHGQLPTLSSYHIVTPDAGMPAGTPPGNMTPGGDFGWLKKSYTWDAGWGVETEDGDRHGHNIVASDFGYAADKTNVKAPGGTFDASRLACNSCHDNHGKYRRLSTGAIVTTGAPIIDSGSYNNSPDPTTGKAVGVYRLLRGIGSSVPGGATFAVNPLTAVAPSTYNRSEAVTDTRVAYGKGVSDWCATCHPDMHTQTSSKMTHVVNQMLGTIVTNNYNKYKGSGNLTGTSATSYDSIVPFQIDNSITYSVLKAQAVNDGSVRTGPATSDRVMCLSCHRAHASGWKYMTRWNNESELIAVEGVWPGTDSPNTIARDPKYSQGRTIVETTAAYNNKPMVYGSYQRSLCNKCHAKD